MKVAIITDTHYGARKGSKHLHDYFELFYKNVFFPTLEDNGIDTVIHMGDAFDSRKAIDFQSLEWAKRVVFEPLKKYNVHMIIGNHDCYYKNTNNVNSPELLLQTYPNIKTYSTVSEAEVGGLNILFIPWINAENYQDTLNSIKVSDSVCAMGHLEPTDLERIADTSWKKVWRATYLRSSTKCFQDTTIHGATTDESST